MYGVCEGLAGSLVGLVGLGYWGLGDDVSTAQSQVPTSLTRNPSTTVGDLVNLFLSEFTLMNPSDALAAAQAGMANYIRTQQPSISLADITQALLNLGPSATIDSVTAMAGATRIGNPADQFSDTAILGQGIQVSGPASSQSSQQAAAAAFQAAQQQAVAVNQAFGYPVSMPPPIPVTIAPNPVPPTPAPTPTPTPVTVAPTTSTSAATSPTPSQPQTQQAVNSAAGVPPASSVPANTAVIAQSGGAPVAVTTSGAVVPVTQQAAQQAAASGTPATSGDIMLGTFDLSQFVTGSTDGIPGWAILLAGGLLALMVLRK